MSDDFYLARVILRRAGVSLLDAARIIQHILDFRPNEANLAKVPFCMKVVQAGLSQPALKECRLHDAYELYLKTKDHLRPASLHDIKYLWKRLQHHSPRLAQAHFSTISLRDCEQWLSETFETPSQFNKGRTMLHGLFEFAMRQEWCSRNVVHLIAKKRIHEQEIKALGLGEIQRLIRVSEEPAHGTCSAGVAMLLWAGLRPSEVQRLRWGDIDLEEKIITVRSECSKTGGVRQVDICRALSRSLSRYQRLYQPDDTQHVCPTDWQARWRRIRNEAGFKGRWVQDVLRHTFASYHAKHYKDMALLQWNMGHRDQSLLRSRYVNLHGITKQAAKLFFSAQWGTAI